MKYCIITYGCQMNEADSRLMSFVLNRAGWLPCESEDEADLVILNTCTVRERPQRKVYSKLADLRRNTRPRSDALVAVVGCLAQQEGPALLEREPRPDLILGTRSFHRIAQLAARARDGERPLVDLDMHDDPSAARCRAAEGEECAPLRAFVPVIRGCSNFCTYCIVPRVRGPEISRPVSDIAEEIAMLAARGTREVTLLGQNVLAYGRDLDIGLTFPGLLRTLAGEERIWRIRFTTCHPRDVDDDLVAAMAEVPSVCEHIHLPIQAGADRILREMNRGYTTAHYLDLVDRLRERVPGLAITTDIMVGFPGESDDEFEESLRLYERIEFDGAFTFAYSPRPGTQAAAREDQVPVKTRLERLQRLIDLQNRITVARNQTEVGRVVEVLVDGRAPRGEGLLAGRARNNKQVIFAGDDSLAGYLVRVRITSGHLWGLRGDLVNS
jgi:tRNA-2-methylthio-N6-dimethylallyladenosine synthase